MQVFSFDNQMKKTGIDMIKAGSVLSLMMFIICLIIYVFNGIEFSMVMILTGFLFIAFNIIGFTFLIQQKDIQFNEGNLIIKPIYRKHPFLMDIEDVTRVKIIMIGNYQPKIVITFKNKRYAFNVSNTAPKNSVLRIKDYFLDQNVKVLLKDKGIRW